LIRADDIHVPTLTWEKLDIVSNIGDDLPDGRKDYAIGYSADQDEIIIFGGRTADNKILDDTWLFNLSSRTWRKPLYTDINPPARYSMVYGNDQPPSNSYRNAFIITGGKGNKKIYNDVWSFDFIRECWVEITASGDLPAPRYDAVGGIDITKFSKFNQLSTIYLILSHGRDDLQHFTDTYILKLDGRSQQGDYSKLTAEWIKLNTENAPELKDGVANSVLSNDRLVVFGGCEENKGNCDTKSYFLNVKFDPSRAKVELASWTELSNDCTRPKAYAAAIRGSNGAADETENDRLIIYGGVTETKYGADADGEVAIFDMDKRTFFGVQPTTKSKEFPKAAKGAKMITTTPKSGDFDGFYIILYGGEPTSKGGSCSTDIWRLSVSRDYKYFQNPEGVTLTKCYEIQNVSNNEDNSDLFRDTTTPKKESALALITFILAFLIAIPALITTSRALNCFTNKWKVIFFILGGISLVLAVLNLAISTSLNKLSILVLKIILVGLLLIFLIFPLIRPKQPGIDFNQGEVNAAGVPVASVENKGRKNKKVYKDNISSSSSYLIETSLKEKANTAATEINVESESVNTPGTPTNQLKKLTIDQNYKDVNRNKADKNDSYLSPIYINPNIKEDAGEDDSDASEVEDEDEVIKNKYLSRANLWLTLLRGVGLVLLIGCIVLALLTAYWNQSKLYNCKIIIYIWIILVVILYIAAIIFARIMHASSAILHTRRISFRRSDPLEPNPVSPSWAMTNDQMKRYSLSETSAYDDIGNVSNYSQSVKNFNQMSGAQSTAATNAPVIGGGSSASSVSAPPLPVNSVYVSNNGLFSIQSNYNYQNQNQSPNSSLVNQAPDPSIYKASEMTNIPVSSTDYPSYRDVNTNINSNIPAMSSNQATASSSVVPSPLIITNGNNERIATTNGSIGTFSNPSPQSQAHLIPNLQYNQLTNHSNNSSPLLEESPIQINTVDQDASYDFPERNNTIENMNNKEVMMVMTVPKRKLAVVNL
jgi:hypothetical protein